MSYPAVLNGCLPFSLSLMQSESFLCSVNNFAKVFIYVFGSPLHWHNTFLMQLSEVAQVRTPFASHFSSITSCEML